MIILGWYPSSGCARADPLTARMIRYFRRALLRGLKVPDTSLADVSEFLENYDHRWEIIREARVRGE